MTVSYPDKSFFRLLFYWKGSVWKLVLKYYIVFLAAYFVINLSYRYAFTDEQQTSFEQVVKLFSNFETRIPLQFLIGFYVTSIFSRWWDQLNYLAYPDKFILLLTAGLNGMDAESVQIRRTFARYCNLLNVLVWKEISKKVKKRFPTDEHLLKAGLLTKEEYQLYLGSTGTYGRWFVPVSWMVNLLAKCHADGRLTERWQKTLTQELYSFRLCSAMLTVFDWINIPLVYTQVVTIATYGYFVFSLIGRQSLIAGHEGAQEVELVFPLFTTLEFIFYFGWMKVGEELECPFGEGDDDFDMNYVLDRNVTVATMLADELCAQRPASTVQETFYDAHTKQILPHTKASYKVRDAIPNWRLASYKIKPIETDFLPDSNFLIASNNNENFLLVPVGEEEDNAADDTHSI